MTELDKERKDDNGLLTIDDLLKMGDVCIDLKDYGPAIDNFNEILKTEPHNFRALFNLGVIYATIGVHNKAVKYWKSCTELNPQFLTTWFYLGTLYFKLEMYNEAAKCFEEILRIDIQNPSENPL